AKPFTYSGCSFLPIASGGRRFILAAVTPEVFIDWDADIHWIGSSTDNGAVARKQSAAGEGRGDLSPLAPRNLDPLPTRTPEWGSRLNPRGSAARICCGR